MDVRKMSILMGEICLLPWDAIHLAVLQKHGLTDIASGDEDFDRVSGMTKYAPEKT